jgi:chromosome segregation protein
MHVKTVQIIGFKSFADKTEVHFEKGITCVVGPNGCGKSNISDAIRWVLGERSAKLLRGSRMEDLIFSGTEFRKPMGMAEVSLIIDNSDKTLPIGFDEVVITRRLYRSGESEYLINKTSCRYKDIQELILDTGIGSNSYSMVEQGKIDYILNADEEERRFLIEEAAGISKYKVKKEEALRKLERTEANLLRLNDIVSEVEKNIRYAERQAKRAEKYKAKLEDLKHLEITKALRETEALEKEKTALESERAALAESHGRYERELSREEAELRRLEDAMKRAEEVLRDQERKKYEAKLALAEAESRFRLDLEKREDFARANQALEMDFARFGERLSAIDRELAVRETERAALAQEFAVRRDGMAEIKQEYEQVRGILAQRGADGRRTEDRLFELAREIAELRNRQAKLELERAHYERERERDEGRLLRLRAEREEIARKMASLPAEASRDTGEDGQQGIGAKSQAREVLARSLATLEESLVEIRARLKEIEFQVKLFEEWGNGGIGTERVPELILEEGRREGSLIQGLVRAMRDVIEVKKGYETAIRAALSDWAHAVIVNDCQAAMKVLEVAEKLEAKELAILVNQSDGAGSAKGAPPPVSGLRGRATEFVRVAPDCESVVAEHLAHVFIVDRFDREQIREWSQCANGFKLVSKDGFVLGPGFKIQYWGSGGKIDLPEGAGDTKNLQAEAQSLQKQLAVCEEERQALKAELVVLDREIRTIEKESFEIRASLSADLKRLGDEMAFEEDEIREAEREVTRLAGEMETLQPFARSLAEKEAHHEAVVRVEADGTRSLAEKKEALFEKLTRESEEANGLAHRERFLAESLELLSRGRTDEIGLQEKRRREHAENAKAVSLFDSERGGRESQLEILRDAVRAGEKGAERLIGERDSLAGLREGAALTVDAKKRELAAVKDEDHARELSVMEINYRIGAIGERLRQSYRVDLSNVDRNTHRLEGIDLAQLEGEITELSRQLESLGTVNLLAVEEYESLKERYGFLCGQKQDLEKGREELLEAIRRINRETKKLFEDTFAKVREAFGHYFRILFGGGDADLVLVDETQPLESGIDIRVKLPGKAGRGISLLSGGEKALVTTALIFALFQVKPSPFCLLDEMDAPFDESNVGRFLAVVRTFLERTQFILVTHNRKTIAASDCLYGVTMQEPGVSKLVSVKLIQESPNAVPPAVVQAGKGT